MRGLVLAILAALVAEPTVARGAPGASDEATLALLKTFREEFVPIAPGEKDFPAAFVQGAADGEPAERPPHRVVMGRRFAIAAYEVPQNLWQAVMGENPSRWKGPRNSVEMLSYDDALEFCRRATTLMRAAGLITDRQVIRLPSESEWEYAARASTTTRYSFGDDAGQLPQYGWFAGNAAGNDPAVGAKRPNAWKLYDVHGYLWEWCADAWHDNYEGSPTDGSAWADDGGGQGVLRGGSWKDPAERLTSSYRRSAPQALKDDAVGLRCVLGEVR